MFLLALKPQVAAFVVELGWLTTWLLLTHSDWNTARGNGSIFRDVYGVVYKIIILLAVWRGVAILRHALKRWLSLKFHHRAHYKDMMARFYLRGGGWRGFRPHVRLCGGLRR